MSSANGVWRPGLQDKVVLRVPDNPRLHRAVGEVFELTEWGAFVRTEVGSGQFRALWEEMLPVPTVVPVPLRPAPKQPDPKILGYTGDVCDNCQGSRVTMNGACKKCEDCGQTTGCS